LIAPSYCRRGNDAESWVLPHSPSIQYTGIYIYIILCYFGTYTSSLSLYLSFASSFHPISPPPFHESVASDDTTIHHISIIDESFHLQPLLSQDSASSVAVLDPTRAERRRSGKPNPAQGEGPSILLETWYD